MPRRIRSAAPAQKPEFEPTVFNGGVPWPTRATKRFWCPCCGMVADLDRLNDAPHPVQVKIQRYGGSRPGYIEKHGELKRAGYMEYFDVDEGEYREVLESLLTALHDAYQEVLAELGESEDVPGYTPAPTYTRALPEYKRAEPRGALPERTHLPRPPSRQRHAPPAKKEKEPKTRGRKPRSANQTALPAPTQVSDKKHLPPPKKPLGLPPGKD